MTPSNKRLSGLSIEEKRKLLKQLVAKKTGGEPENGGDNEPASLKHLLDDIPESAYRFSHFPQYHQLHIQRVLGERAGIQSPFFMVHDGIARDTTVIGGRKFLNFSTYNYLDFNGDPRVIEAAVEATRRFGTSASASRLVSGERPSHRALERALADLYGVEDCVVFVSGHATNVSTIATLMGSKDLVLHDRLIHNSALQGAIMSEATRLAFAHNDMDALEAILVEQRSRFEKVLIVVEGIYSMDGDIAPLDRLVELKNRYKSLLMVDEAHSAGVLGHGGRGIADHFGIPANAIDIIMGTLSKAFAGCGGYIAGERALVELLKFTAGSFVYSVGMPPSIAAAAKTCVDLMLAEPWRVERLRENGRHFIEAARERGLNSGLSAGYTVTPILIGRSVLAGRLSNALIARGVNVQPIIYPAVEEKMARLRFFITSAHTSAQIDEALDRTAEELHRLEAEMAAQT